VNVPAVGSDSKAPKSSAIFYIMFIEKLKKKKKKNIYIYIYIYYKIKITKFIKLKYEI